MVQRTDPVEYFKAVVVPETASVPQPPISLVDQLPAVEDNAFKYVVIVGVVVISIAALKYILKD